MENHICEESNPWRIKSVENQFCGESILWRINSVEIQFLGKEIISLDKKSGKILIEIQLFLTFGQKVWEKYVQNWVKSHF